ncbi:DUF167 family protein [Paenochrobactrum sp. BZR 588]|uniref:DUF167 family protein n=1 Tax=unclassified Paenochrobactrum TaxID=2639760 RepID=UPI0035BC3B13
MSISFYRLEKEGVTLFVRLTPKASKDAVETVITSADERCYLSARVRAVPEKGLANKALEKLLAKSLQVPASTVSVDAGATSRIKQIFISGDPEILAKRLDQFS